MHTFAEKPKPAFQAAPAARNRMPTPQAGTADLEPPAQALSARRIGHAFGEMRVYAGAAAAVREPAAEAAPAEVAPPTAQGGHRARAAVERYPFRASIPRGPRAAVRLLAPTGPLALAAPSRSDSPQGEEHGGEAHRALFEQLSTVPPSPAGPSAAGPAGTPAPAAEGLGAPISVPDIEAPALAEVEKTDAVKGAFTYSGSIAKSGAAPSGFGVTRSFSAKLTGVTITPNAGTFDIAATFEHPITYQVRSGTGPSGQVDIASDADGDLTNANFGTAATALTPDMTDLNGRPPRSGFWAEDLTLKHELVHANDDKGNGPGAMATVTTWLNGKTAATAAEATMLLGALPGRFASALLAALSTEDGEKHAYGDGAPSYKARADAIKAKGAKGTAAGGYP